MTFCCPSSYDPPDDGEDETEHGTLLWAYENGWWWLEIDGVTAEGPDRMVAYERLVEKLEVNRDG